MQSVLCRGETQTWTHGLGSRFWFQVKPVFPSLPRKLLLRRIPYRSLWSYPWDRPLVDSWENQSLAAATIKQRFGHCICSELKYGERTEYVRVQAWTGACEQSVYVICVPGWFIKWDVIVMVMFDLHPYQTSTRTGASKVVAFERGGILNNLGGLAGCLIGPVNRTICRGLS